MTTDASRSQSFHVERRGDIAIITPSPEVESMHDSLMQQAAEMVLAPLKDDQPTGLIIDLTQLKYFGSVFINFLLKCHIRAKRRGSDIVLAGVSERGRELLRMTNLDTLWAIYDSRAQALEALGGSD